MQLKFGTKPASSIIICKPTNNSTRQSSLLTAREKFDKIMRSQYKYSIPKVYHFKLIQIEDTITVFDGTGRELKTVTHSDETKRIRLAREFALAIFTALNRKEERTSGGYWIDIY